MRGRGGGGLQLQRPTGRGSPRLESLHNNFSNESCLGRGEVTRVRPANDPQTTSPYARLVLLYVDHPDRKITRYILFSFLWPYSCPLLPRKFQILKAQKKSRGPFWRWLKRPTDRLADRPITTHQRTRVDGSYKYPAAQDTSDSFVPVSYLLL